MSVVSYKCPNCGGDLRFDPKSQKYKCEFCQSQFEQGSLEAEQSASQEKPESRPQPQPETEGEAVVYHCPSCGAEIVTEETTAATFCYYCHNPVVLEGRLSGDLLPDSVIPFQLDKKEAISCFLDYVKSKRFIPNAFFCKEQIDKLSGVYFPFWVCDCKVEGYMKASATNLRIYRMGDIEYTETKVYDVVREGELSFSQITKNALEKGNRRLVEGVQPFRIEEAKPFSMGFLSGFMAEKRDMEKEKFTQEIKGEIEAYTQTMLRDEVSGYSTVNPTQVQVTEKDSTWKYVLLPVWVLTYKGKDDKLYYYAMNGQTRNICGELPIDYKKVAALFAMIALPILILLLLGGYFLW